MKEVIRTWIRTQLCLTRSKHKKRKKRLEDVYCALKRKDYNPIDQLVGYLISGDPSYITSYHNARTLIKGIDRDELIAEMLREYIDVSEA